MCCIIRSSFISFLAILSFTNLVGNAGSFAAEHKADCSNSTKVEVKEFRVDDHIPQGYAVDLILSSKSQLTLDKFIDYNIGKTLNICVDNAARQSFKIFANLHQQYLFIITEDQSSRDALNSDFNNSEHNFSVSFTD